MAPIGITNGSTTMSHGLMPKSAARFTILRATSKRTSGSSLIPVSSFEMATTGTLYFATSGKIASSFSSSPVTELTSGRPRAVSNPALRADVTELSMHSGISVIDCTISKVWRINGGSVSLGFTAVTPALISRMCAPAATCANTSLITVSKLPACISAASFLRPVGLMRSPITVKGLSNPIMCSRVADATRVCVMRYSGLHCR